MTKKLTNREKIFVREYLVDLDPRRAGIVAGYSKTMAESKIYQWVSNCKVKPHVFNAIKKAMNKRSKKIEITSDYVLRNIKEIGEHCMQTNKENGALKAQELLGKHLKLFTDVLDARHSGNIVIMPTVTDGKKKPIKYKIGQNQ